MQMLNVDSIIVFLYLLLTLIVGMYSGRNIKNMKEFAIGDRKFSTSALTATFTATWIGAGVTIGIHEKVYQHGIIWMFIFMGEVAEIFIYRLFVPYMGKFKGNFSAAEILGKWYGPKARLITGLCTALYCMGLIGAQLGAVGYLFKEFFNISPELGIIIGAGIVVMYSSFGGIKAVTYTDVIQFAFFIVAIPLIANVLLGHVGGYKELITRVPSEHFKLLPEYGNSTQYLLLLIVFFAIPSWDPSFVQRILMSKDKYQMAGSFNGATLVLILFYLVCTQIALSVLVLKPDLDPNNILYYVINNYLPTGIKGLGIAGLLAVIMSTADSYLNTSSVALIHDVINPLRRESLNSKQELVTTKFTSLIMGISAILVAVSFESIVDIMLKTWVLWVPIVVVPMTAAVINIRSNSQTFVISSIVGISTAILWTALGYEDKTEIEPVIPGLVANLIVFTLLSYYYHKFARDKLYIPIINEQEDGATDFLPTNKKKVLG
ncbi:MAG: sodium:solute symporter family protein [Sphingobacteriia bacterium]|nr:sodium:solute symporter family protein [Sphingobacteriia bacterium]